MQRLMNIAHEMRQQNQCDGLCNFAGIFLPDFPTQYSDAIRNGVHDIPLATPNFAVAVFSGVEYGHIRVVEPMMRWGAVACTGTRRIRVPKVTQLSLDLRRLRIMRIGQ